ncbi:MAG: hypothetical protein JSS30_01855 [Verrucomicrobia bacterium]|nr:hypothetical protein [Verrucomicrobiota bacterium]
MSKLLVLFATLFSTPAFAFLFFDSGCPDCVCVTNSFYDHAACWGNCECHVEFFPGPFPPFPSPNCLCQSEVGSILLSQQLIYNQIGVYMNQIYLTGMFGPFVGTYPDYESLYFLDAETAFTNEITVLPSWCE